MPDTPGGEPPHVIDDLIARHRQAADGIFRHHGVHPFDAPAAPRRDPAPTPPEGMAAFWGREVSAVARGIGHLVHRDPPPLAAQVARAREQSQPPAGRSVNLQTPPPEENPMGFITDLKHDLATAAHDVAARAAEFETTILPAAAGKLTALEGNPVVDALLTAVHVPVEDLDIVVQLINKLETMWNPDVAAAPADPQPAAPAPAPVPAGQ